MIRQLSIAALALAFFSGSLLWGDDIVPDRSTQYGHIDQNTPGITNGGNACGPTSAYNSFVYLAGQNPGLNGLLGTDAVSAINEIGKDMSLPQGNTGGVFDNNFISGKIQYIHDHGLDNKVSVEYQAVNPGTGRPSTAHPSEAFLYEQLAKGQDVEVGFGWNGTGGGGHWVTATGLDFNTTSDTGTLDFVDPWGGVDIQGNLSLDANGNLVLSYSGGAAGNPADTSDNPGDASSGTIDIIVAESPVPLPSVAWAGFGCLVGFAGFQKVRQGRQLKAA
ncbi:MAG: hypothetical protein JWL69_2407 [Phycisphaerales bacterium]|nr:hypothetical protein [Phycisphaerales bacterium]MDB5357458.1 hypothetical protein [Phycisphaerales bacterium]